MESIRTLAEIPLVITFVDPGANPPIYIRIVEKVVHLHELGMNPNKIAVALKVDRGAVVRALRYAAGKDPYGKD